MNYAYTIVAALYARDHLLALTHRFSIHWDRDHAARQTPRGVSIWGAQSTKALELDRSSRWAQPIHRWPCGVEGRPQPGL